METAKNTSVYSATTPPEDYVAKHAAGSADTSAAKNPSGIDAPVGTVLANVAAPLMLYTQLKGKSDLWDKQLQEVPDELMREPTLDVGCGRGLVALKMAERKKALTASTKAYAVSNTEPETPAANAATLDVLPYLAVHRLDANPVLPFADKSFSLVTTSLWLHHQSSNVRQKMMHEMIRVCRPGGRIIVVDLMGWVNAFRDIMKEAGWPEKDIQVRLAGPGIMYGMWPGQLLTATCPE